MIKALQIIPRCWNVKRPCHKASFNCSPKNYVPLLENPQGYDLLPSWIDDGTCEDYRMVWVAYFIPETKIGTR
jgi:hypothetical protein